MRRSFHYLTATIVALLGTAFLAAPAQAMLYTSSITFNAAPEPVAAGSYVTLSGTAGYKTSGNAATVRFYFRRYNAAAFTLITSTTAASTGTFTLKVKQSTSGSWKAVYAGNSIRKPVSSNLDYVEAKAWRNVVSNRSSFSGAGDYTSPVLTWYTDRPAKVSVQVQCTEASPFNFYGVAWFGHPNWGFDDATFDFTGTSTSGSSFIYPDQRTGYIDIVTQDGCTGTVTVSQVVRAYVKV
ncbi:MAG TPA: hypothetical protein VF657_20065 [Actinoplanes sp.]|jgi:hypothetical protein